MVDVALKPLGALLRAARNGRYAGREIGEEEIKKVTGIGRGTYNSWELGRKTPNALDLFLLAQALEIPLHDLQVAALSEKRNVLPEDVRAARMRARIDALVEGSESQERRRGDRRNGQRRRSSGETA